MAPSRVGGDEQNKHTEFQMLTLGESPCDRKKG